MHLTERIESLAALSHFLDPNREEVMAVIHRTSALNPWFTEEYQIMAINHIRHSFLHSEILTNWAVKEGISEESRRKKVGLVLAANIPLVGFHDWLSVIISGHDAVVKLSERDPYWLPFLIQLLQDISPALAERTQVVNRLESFAAVIATGSNNSSRYFEHYFSKYPNIIRKNRRSIAVLDGTESDKELQDLLDDIFHYFGLGCRSVSHLYLPTGYSLDPLISLLNDRKALRNHHKYANNYDHNFALFLINRVPHIQTESVLLTEEQTYRGKIAVLTYEYYDSQDQLLSLLEGVADELQCKVGLAYKMIRHGSTQFPAIDDYADDVNTIQFLKAI